MKVLRYAASAIFATVFLMASQCARAQIPPSITTQPQSQVADYASDVVFMVSATGTEPLSYQWWDGYQRMEDYGNVAGSHTATLYLVGVGQSDARSQSYYVVITNAAGAVTSSWASLTVGPRVVLQDDFENGLGQWTPLLNAEPMGIDNSHNHTPNGAFSAVITNSAQKMYYRLDPKDRLDPKQGHGVRMTMWLFDAGGPQTAYGELRSYTGSSGYARYVWPYYGWWQCIAAGIYTSDFGTNNTGSLAGETLDPTKYQGRVMAGANSGWFNLNAPGAPGRSPGWHKFQIDRSTSGTTVDFYVDDVLAREILDVKQAALDTVTIGSTGRDEVSINLMTGHGESNQWPVVPVRAWFDDVTIEAFQNNHDHQSLASHGPIPAMMQLRETGTNAVVVDVSPTTVCELSGAATNNGMGSWMATNSEIIAQDVRGYLEYSVNAPSDNAYRIEVEGRENDYKWPQVDLKLIISLDDEELGRVDLPYGPSSNGLAHCFTPFIRAGAHKLEIYWDNAHPRYELALHAVRLQTLIGGASTNNGMSMWVANRLLAQCGMDSAPAASLVSPVCLEGRGSYLSMMSLVAGTDYPLSPVSVHHGAGNRWYANVPLTASAQTHVEISYQNGGLIETNDIEWKVTNLLDATNAVIRKGDSLLFTALPEGATDGAVRIKVEGQEPMDTDAITPVPYQFNAAGTYIVMGIYGPTKASGSITVTVVDASLDGSCPASLPEWWSWWTYWDCTNWPAGVVLDSDPRLDIWGVSAAERAERLTNAPSLGVNGQEFKVAPRSPETRYVLARLGNKGPILADTAILGFQLLAPPNSSLRLVSTRGDGSQVIEGTYVLSPRVAPVGLKISVVTGGVTFDDGTLTKTLTTADFDELGVCRVDFIRAAGLEGSVCMLLDLERGAP
jgi:hypothetical protein